MLKEYSEKGLLDLIDAKVEENLYLDYKSARSLELTDKKREDIAINVSSFANSDGGQLIYGVKEFDDKARRHLPERIDPIDRTVCSKEQLEQIINSRIMPKIPGLRVFPIDCTGGVVYVVDIPKGRTAHQASDHRYYKRFNFESRPMEDYEINDIRLRRETSRSLIHVDVEINSSHMVYIVVANVDDYEARDITFDIPGDILWLREAPSMFVNGSKLMLPGKKFLFHWNMSHRLFQEAKAELRKIEMSVTYTHGLTGKEVTDEFYLDLEDFRSGSTLRSDVERLEATVKECAKDLTRELARLSDRLEFRR